MADAPEPERPLANRGQAHLGRGITLLPPQPTTRPLGVLDSRLPTPTRTGANRTEILGRVGGQPDVPSEEMVQQARIATARRQAPWTEIDKSELEQRGRQYVHRETGEIYTACKQSVFEACSANILGATIRLLAFYVTDEGDIYFFEKAPNTVPPGIR